MTRFKFLFAVIAVAAITAGMPAAQAQESCGTGCLAHFVGAGSSAQFIMSAIAADQAAVNANTALYGGAGTIMHWSKKYSSTGPQGGELTDDRDSLGRILPETANVWAVWIENSGNVTDLWTDFSVDSTVGVRCFSAVQTNLVNGCGLVLLSAAGTGSDNAVLGTSQQALWPDGNNDVSIDAAAVAALNSGLQVNVGMTDIRPEDALFATNRAIAALNTTTYAGLGYTGPTKEIGAPIYTDQGVLQGTGSTGSIATPIGFALAGKKDPINGKGTVPAYTTYPLGAAPIIFITNNGSATGPAVVTNLVTGITPDLHVTGQKYPLANLFDGTTSCDTHNAAFGGPNDGGGTPLTLFLREPLSGTMNTTEFNLFRSFDNTNDSQEVGVTNPTRSPYNPLQLGCSGGHGTRSRAIGTGEVLGKASAYGLLDTNNSLGYVFWGWGNAGKFKGSAQFNYLTIDGVDPVWQDPTAYSTCQGGTAPNNDGAVCDATAEQCTAGTGGVAGTCTAGGSTNQTVPYCTTATCSVNLWGTGESFPNLRNGTYKAWSIYRWIAVPNSDTYGPAAVAQEAQNYVDQDIADFVPFSACAPGQLSCATPTDGLAVFRSHFTPKGVSLTGVCTLSNGSVTTANSSDGGNTLGGGTECGGDVGGLVYGPFGTTGPAVGYVLWTATLTAGKGYKVTWKQGDKFVTTWSPGSDITLAGQVVQLETNSTATTLYVNAPNPGSATIAVSFAGPAITHGAASATQDGTPYHNKHQ